MRWLGICAALVMACNGFLSAQEAKDTKVLADFEDGTGGIFKTVRGTIGESKELDGKAVTLKPRQNIAVDRPAIDWSSYNLIIIDTFNPADAPARVQLCFKDDTAPHGYYSWINRYVAVKPGRSTIELYIPELRRGEGSPKDMLDTRPFHWDKLQWWGIAMQIGDEVQLDNIRLVKLDVSIPEGVQAFDFGPPGSPVFIGTTGVTPEDAYDDAKGFGWTQ